MTNATSGTGLQLRSTVKTNGILELSLARVTTPEPKPEEVIVRIDASPINPSDQGLLFAGADMSTVKASGTAENPVVTASISPAVMKAMACLVLPPGTTPAEGASCFVNPLTALGMVETMRAQGHKALVHTAAASNLGQMLNKICIKDKVDLVNIVRKPEHVDVLKKAGATHVCNSSSPTFMDDLTEALVATGATLAFDAIGGGRLAGQILTAMEVAANRTAKEYSRYGSTTHKQVYIYGGLDRGPTEFNRAFGMAWGIGGWLLTPFLQKVGFEAAQKLRERVAAEIKSTFASTYTKEVSLAEALRLEEIAIYGKQATGEKYLINPNKGVR